MKKRISVFLCLATAFTFLMASGAAALTLNTVETAAEAAVVGIAEATLAAVDEMPETEHPEYGTLIYFNNFESGVNNPALNTTGLKLSGVNTWTETMADYTCLGATKISDQWHRPVLAMPDGGAWKYADGSPIAGTVTLVADIYAGASALNPVGTVNGQAVVTGAFTDTGVGGWNTAKAVTASAESVKTMGYQSEWSWGVYLKNVRLYIKDIPDAGESFTLANEANGDMVVIVPDGETYTLPAALNGYGVSLWNDGKNTYEAGETVAVAGLIGKTLQVLRPALEDEVYGTLVYFNNFKNGAVNAPEYNKTGLTLQGVGGIGALSLSSVWMNDVGDSRRTLTLTMPNGGAWKYADGTPMDGTVTVIADVLLRATVSADSCQGWRNGVNTGSLLADRVFGVGDDYYQKWQSGKPLRTTTDGLTSIAYTQYWGPMFVRNIRVYVSDKKEFSLLDEATGEKTTVNIVGAAYALPTEFAGDGVSKWTDGASFYDAGAVIESHQLLGKTLYPYLPALSDENYGTLVYFNNFRAGKIDSPEYSTTGLTVSGLYGMGNENGLPCAVVSDAGEGIHKVTVAMPDGGAWQYADGTPIVGTVTVVMDVWLKSWVDASSCRVLKNGDVELEHRVFQVENGEWEAWQTAKAACTSAKGLESLTYTQYWGPMRVRNIRVYVNDKLAPKNTEQYDIRLGKTRGMRMTSFVSVLQRELADEYGFIVAVADSFGGDYSTLMFPEDMKGKTALAESVTGKGELPDGTRFVYATSYAKAADGTVTTDIHKLGTVGDEDGFLMNAVLVNISAEMYATKFAVRPYVRVDGSYFYGETMVKSIQDVAKVLYEDDDYLDSLSDDDFDYITAIVEAREA